MDATRSRPWYRPSRITTNKTRRWPQSVGGGRRTIIVVVVAGVSRTCCRRGVRSAFDDSYSRGLRLTARGGGDWRIYLPSFQRKKAHSANPLSHASCKVKGVYTARIKKNSLIKKNKIVILFK